MYYEVRIIYKDGTCAVYNNCQLCAVGTYIAIVPCNLQRDIIKIDIVNNEYNRSHIKAVKIAIKGGVKFI